MSLIQAIPAVEAISDPNTRRALIAMRANLEVGHSVKGKRDDQFVTKGLLKSAGIMGFDDNGNPYKIPDKVKTSTISNFLPSLVADGGLLTDKRDCAGLTVPSTIYFDLTIPQNAIITRTWYDVLVDFTAGSGAPEVEVSLQYDSGPAVFTDLVTSSVLGVGWTAGRHDGVQDGSAANMSEKLTGYYSIQINVGGTGDIAAGIFRLFVDYVVSE